MKQKSEQNKTNISKAWKKGLDTDKSGSLKKEELVEAMSKLGHSSRLLS